jgi:hypothetical protein
MLERNKIFFLKFTNKHVNREFYTRDEVKTLAYVHIASSDVVER